jgi:hypothetical protein
VFFYGFDYELTNLVRADVSGTFVTHRGSMRSVSKMIVLAVALVALLASSTGGPSSGTLSRGILGAMPIRGALAQEADVEVDEDGEVMFDDEQEAPPPPEDQGQAAQPPPISREVFMEVLRRSSPKCREELQAFATSQGEVKLSDECNMEAGAAFAQIRQEYPDGNIPTQASEEVPEPAAAPQKDATTEVLILVGFIVLVTGGVAGFIACRMPTVLAEEASKRPDREKEAAKLEKKNKKRARQGKAPIQNNVEVY